MFSTTIPINGTFDIAKGRKTLRTHIATRRWAPAFSAKAAGALTALGEFILFTCRHELVIVRLSLHDSDEISGVEFTCNMRISPDMTTYEGENLERLKRATDQLNISNVGGTLSLQATVRLLLTE